jgi:hypothetical protein
MRVVEGAFRGTVDGLRIGHAKQGTRSPLKGIFTSRSLVMTSELDDDDLEGGD